jgi:hypothetical protein
MAGNTTSGIGAVVEIETANGFVYAQHTHEHIGPPRMGSLIRIIDGVFPEHQACTGDLVSRPTRFQVFFPLAAALKRGSVTLIGSAPVPEQDQRFPIFRNGVRDPIAGKVQTWWLWDGKHEWKVGALSEEQKSYPLLAVWNDTILRERLEAGWRPEDEV